MKKTRWFPGSVTPVRPGRYERRYGGKPYDVLVCRWNGTYWHVHEGSTFSGSISSFQNLPWRGMLK